MLNGNTMNYMDGLIHIYGPDIVKELRYNDRQVKKFTLEDLQKLEDELKFRVKFLSDVSNVIDHPLDVLADRGYLGRE